MEWSTRVRVGDVIELNDSECRVVSNNLPYEHMAIGEYVVEEATNRGGWEVKARKLDDKGEYSHLGLSIRFYQSPGYKHSLTSVKIVRRMVRVFV